MADKLMQTERIKRLAYQLINEYREDRYAFIGMGKHSLKPNSEIKPGVDGYIHATYYPDYGIMQSLLTEQVIPKNLLYGPCADVFRIYISDNTEHIVSRLPIEWKEYLTKGTGTLYMLPNDCWEELDMYGMDIRCPHSIRSLDRVYVNYDLYHMFGGEIRWIVGD